MRELIGRPVIVAPMAGGVSTLDLVVASASAGALAFWPAGYKTAAAMRAEIDAIQGQTDAPFGVNLFMPGEPTRDTEALARFTTGLAAEAAELGEAAGEPLWDDDHWRKKVLDLLDRPVPAVSFTFGCPGPDVIADLQAAGSSVWVTVTCEDEAVLATRAGAGGLAVQGVEAGAHRGTFSNDPASTGDPRGVLELLAAVRAVSDLPLIAAGGITTPDGVAAALAAGAVAVQCGTAFLRCPESGAPAAHKAALAGPGFERTEITRAFSGRPARALVNTFLRDHADAPAAYPEINNVTRPIRAAAAKAGNPERMSLWAGTGYRAATDRPAAEVIEWLCGQRSRGSGHT